ncbi:MAG: helix-turn-helix transcriptional regulator [Alphaproteobacteria bacterium]|nr:helix-turn-helix transcriptional regulator [Alphaproteobacteria bacterium]
MIGLSFDNLPHYIYSNHRQFHTHEHHIDRIFNEDVLILMRKGILRFTEDGKDVELHANEYYIQRAGLHQAGLVESEKPNYFFIHFNGFFEENGDLPIRGTFQSKTIQPLLDKLMLLGLEASKIEYECLFYALLTDLAKQQRGETVAEKIRTYLLQNYKAEISLQDISNHCNYSSKNSIVNIFKKTYGKTPYRYLTDYRLERACEYLVSTRNSLSAIAYDVGFSDYTVFYRAFVEKYDISPKDYRAIKQEKFFIPPENERPKG